MDFPTVPTIHNRRRNLSVPSSFMTSISSHANATTTVGFGTAGLGINCYYVVHMALEAGFRRFDTAEADLWYDQRATGKALLDFFGAETTRGTMMCQDQLLEVSTKIPPWSLTSVDDIRNHAARSRQELVGFCDGINEGAVEFDKQGNMIAHSQSSVYPLDVYYIHAPACWQGWHPKCEDPPPIIPLRDAWMGMEYVAGVDRNAKRIGLSNVRPDELLDIIQFAQQRKRKNLLDGPPPRIPDVVQAFADPIRPAEEIRKICEQYSIEFVSYSTLGTQHRGAAENPVLNHPYVQNLATKYDRSNAEVVLSWALQRGMSIIPRSSKRHHIEQLARLLVEEPTFLKEHDLLDIDKMKNII